MVGSATADAIQPANLPLKPFFSQYDRRSAVYFPVFTELQWRAEQKKLAGVRAHEAQLEARSTDRLVLGDEQSERDHQLQANTSETVLYRGRTGRWARGATPFEFRMRVKNGPLNLQAIYWGKQRNSRFRIYVDDVLVGSE